MVDNKPLMEQVHEYENLTADVLNEDMKMCEIFQANVLLEKFPPSWSDYRNQLKHKKNNLTLQELISHMRTEEANRLKDKMEELSLNSSKANLVESSGTVVKDMFKGKHKKVSKKEHMKKKNQFNKLESHIQKFKGLCFVCRKVGHRATKCYQRKGQDSKNEEQSDVQAHLANGNEVITVVVVEANRVANEIDRHRRFKLIK
ncbi:hypothetical protein KY290_027850 [Solanum tuberosum]|uniref:CCHC-type domain-containing protein n=1 Tax=Solanum tuberosum TaxID=4113 RepID=A0ABQ7UHF5_SOLTU|nr:hypothetical protein KY290_027850 [Solanum tuberosum]